MRIRHILHLENSTRSIVSTYPSRKVLSRFRTWWGWGWRKRKSVVRGDRRLRRNILCSNWLLLGFSPYELVQVLKMCYERGDSRLFDDTNRNTSCRTEGSKFVIVLRQLWRVIQQRGHIGCRIPSGGPSKNPQRCPCKYAHMADQCMGEVSTPKRFFSSLTHS